VAAPKPPSETPAPAPKHRRWVVHSHEATRPKAGGAMSDINITPMIDVLLVLLIIFMVVTPLAQKGLDIALPQPNPNKAAEQPQNVNTVVLALEQSPTGPIYTVNKNAVGSLEELDNRLKDIFQTRSDKTLFVRANGDVLYGKVVEAMDIAKGAGVERIGIMTESMLEAAGATGGGGQ
jgi:biopolymer transport protein ExbD/biopolymer transport protein TolR